MIKEGAMFEQLTDMQWALLEGLFKEPEKRGRGKPHAPWRAVVNSVLHVYLTGCKWDAVPKLPGYASKSTSHRWFVRWKEIGLLDQIVALVRSNEPLAVDY